MVLTEMTMEQVLLARGEPARNAVISPDAELWHYPGGEVAVEGWETVSVPAETFRGIRVDPESELYDPSTGERTLGTDTSWYVPEVRRSVKSDTTGKGGSRRLIQLISYDVQ